jgi:hypothetical protein
MVDLPYNRNNILPADAPIEEQNAYQGTGSIVGNAATQRDPMVNTGLQETLNPSQQKLTDAQLLDKQRRRMMGFAAIADAGAALQGRDGKMVANLLDYFNSQDDSLRKARASEQQLELQRNLAGTLGTIGDIGDGGSRLDQLKAYKQTLLQSAYANPDMIDVFKLQIAEVDQQIKELEQGRAQDQQAVQGADTVLSNISRLAKEVEANPNTTGLIGSVLGAFSFTKAGSLRLDLQTVKANIAFDTLRGIKQGGATLGAVSAPELALLEAKISQLSMDRPAEDVLRSFREVEEYYQQIIRNAYANADDPDELDRMFTQLGYGGRPSWVDQPSGAATIPTYTMENVPAGELAYNPNDQKVYKFNGGDRQDRQNWSEVQF